MPLPPSPASCDVANVVEIMPSRLYWLARRTVPKDTATSHFFSIDAMLRYDAFNADFGPLSLGQTFRYCRMVEAKLNNPSLAGKRIIHCCLQDPRLRANAACLMCLYQVIVQRKTPEEAYRPFCGIDPPFFPFRDAIDGPCSFQLTILDCLEGMHKALEVRVMRDLPVVVIMTEDTEEVQELVLMPDPEATMEPLKVVLDQLPVVEARDLALEVKMELLEAMKDLAPWVVALDLALDLALEAMKDQTAEVTLDLAPWVVALAPWVVALDLALEAMKDQTAEVTMDLAPWVVALDLDLALALALEAMKDQTAEVTMDPPQEVMKDLLLVVMEDQALALALDLDLEVTLDPTHLEQAVMLVKHLVGIVPAPGAMVVQVAQVAPIADAELTDIEFTR